MTYTDGMATTELLDLTRPAAAAAVVDAVNDRLAAEAGVPADVGAEVAALAAAVRATPLDRWTAADPYLALLVHRAVLDARAAVEDEERDALRIALERLSHALAALGEAEEVGDARSPKELAQWLVSAVDVSQRDLAALLGVDLRRFQRWISARERTQPDGEEARRLRAVARLAGHLRHAFTPAGVLAWFDWPRPELDGATPRELLADPVRLPELLLAAGSVRSTAFA
jgi:DNA-binding transcriptional regulator YiaG